MWRKAGESAVAGAEQRERGLMKVLTYVLLVGIHCDVGVLDGDGDSVRVWELNRKRDGSVVAAIVARRSWAVLGPEGNQMSFPR